MKINKIVKEIKDRDGNLRFRRFAILESKYLNIYIHTFWYPEKDLFLHDHPWNFFSLILNGGYIEKTKKGNNSKIVGSYGFYKANHLHQILQISDCEEFTRTLVITGKRRREWGYEKKDGSWISHKEYRETYTRDKREI